jgi:hypothetical protein
VLGEAQLGGLKKKGDLRGNSFPLAKSLFSFFGGAFAPPIKIKI